VQLQKFIIIVVVVVVVIIIIIACIIIIIEDKTLKKFQYSKTHLLDKKKTFQPKAFISQGKTEMRKEGQDLH
jgi:hypothetical protein